MCLGEVGREVWEVVVIGIVWGVSHNMFGARFVIDDDNDAIEGVRIAVTAAAVDNTTKDASLGTGC
jgi:hypothetical protein